MRFEETIRDRIKGVIFGHAIGDALGFGAEGLTKAELWEECPDGLRNFDQLRPKGLAALKRPGSWTDDTSQMLCILESLVIKRHLECKDVARQFYRWLVTDGFGVGFLVGTVLSSPEYIIDPVGVAKRTWEETGRRSAPNGAVMRTSVLGIWEYPDLDAVAKNAANVCRLTHADPRCVASCIAVSVAVACMVGGLDSDRAVTEAIGRSQAVEPGSKERIQLGLDATLEDLDLDCGLSEGEENRTGYTYVALTAGFWALAHSTSFEDGVVAVINEGGDADTNACVAGALLGAKYGFSGIPERFVEGLNDSKYLLSECRDLIELMESTSIEQ